MKSICLLAMMILSIPRAFAGLVCESRSDEGDVVSNLVIEGEDFYLYQTTPSDRETLVVKGTFIKTSGRDYKKKWDWAGNWPESEIYHAYRVGEKFPSFKDKGTVADYILQYSPKAIRSDGSLDMDHVFKDRGFSAADTHREYGKFGNHNARFLIMGANLPGNLITMGNDVSMFKGRPALDLIIGFNCYQHAEASPKKVEALWKEKLDPRFVRLY
jgi:hypothetical protein